MGHPTPAPLHSPVPLDSPSLCEQLAAARLVIESDGWSGLLLRGLTTRLITNAVQASVFTIVWKLVEERIATRHEATDAPTSTSAASAEASACEDEAEPTGTAEDHDAHPLPHAEERAEDVEEEEDGDDTWGK